MQKNSKHGNEFLFPSGIGKNSNFLLNAKKSVRGMREIEEVQHAGTFIYTENDDSILFHNQEIPFRFTAIL